MEHLGRSQGWHEARLRVDRLDTWAFNRLGGARSPYLDAALPALSRAADWSLLWMGVGALMAAQGGVRGRRAALKGLGSIAFTSALVNVLLKLLWRRGRPSPAGGFDPRVRQPRTFSFPSGHTASAFAFAAAAGGEIPWLRLPLGVLAAAVGCSRIHARVHYPSDVLAGAAVGVAAGGLGGRLLTILLANHRQSP